MRETCACDPGFSAGGTPTGPSLPRRGQGGPAGVHGSGVPARWRGGRGPGRCRDGPARDVGLWIPGDPWAPTSGTSSGSSPSPGQPGPGSWESCPTSENPIATRRVPLPSTRAAVSRQGVRRRFIERLERPAGTWTPPGALQTSYGAAVALCPQSVDPSRGSVIVNPARANSRRRPGQAEGFPPVDRRTPVGGSRGSDVASGQASTARCM